MLKDQGVNHANVAEPRPIISGIQLETEVFRRRLRWLSVSLRGLDPAYTKQEWLTSFLSAKMILDRFRHWPISHNGACEACKKEIRDKRK